MCVLRAVSGHMTPIAPKLYRGFFVAAEADKKFMLRALALAERGKGAVSPNPMVGAVIVKNGRVVGEGYHRRAGSDHAEVAALKKAGRKANGATIYVTLEPCCHTGATGPCTETLIAAGIRRVVFSVIDPNPLVNGKGARRLRHAGIDVESGLCAAETRKLNEIYFGYLRLGRPFVTLKLAQTLDGRIASATGDSRWITSKASRKLAHRLRIGVDAVVVGSGTVRSDNPALTVRHVKGRNPYRIVLTSSAKIPKDCHLVKDNTDLRTIIASTQHSIDRLSRNSGRPMTFWQVKADRRGHLSLPDSLARAGEFGLRSLLVEGGATLATSFLKEGLVDKIVLFISPRILGRGVEGIGDLGIRKVSDSLRLKDVTVESVGPDIMVTGYPERGK
jgi:diaminohydroxyphosphoribosylaminopyrimidine deaminase/5-amino-6-(5-phosphoribosylamino)uracil reductase